jgi:hypothetical protein
LIGGLGRRADKIGRGEEKIEDKIRGEKRRRDQRREEYSIR